MDTFMDKLAQKLNAAEMIKANGAAETAQLEQYRAQNSRYEEYLEKLAKTLEAHESGDVKLDEQLKQVLDELSRQNAELRNALDELTNKPKLDRATLEEIISKSDDFNHKEDVKVYRNVQAAMEEALQSQTDVILSTLVAGQKKAQKKAGAALVFAILAFLAALAGVVLQVMDLFSIRFFF